MSDNRDILLAYKMNGELLPPDHGYPIRLVVPGCIGGRSVKWLARIEASLTESTNHFHAQDNKVFPTQVRSAEQASSEGWWQRHEYAIYDLNVNSVITTPAHGERISVQDTEGIYVIKGYAYSGGNQPILRVEVSLDSGKSWGLATFERPPAEELARPYGKLAGPGYYKESGNWTWLSRIFASLYGRPTGPSYYKESRNWTWVRWKLEIPLTDLICAEELVVRAWDGSQNTQPEHLTWNLMGMMNNCWFRVKLSPDHHSMPPTILFEHPTTVSPLSAEGWMEKSKPAKATVADKPNMDLPTYTLAEVEMHASEDSCWIICRSLVYDCTRFLKDHPGGAQSILLVAGADATDDFDAIHSEKAHGMLKDYLIGHLAGTQAHGNDSSMLSSVPAPPSTEIAAMPPAVEAPFLDPKQWKKMTLESKQLLTPNIRLLRFTFGTSETFGLPVGKHVYLKLFQEQLHKDMPIKSVMRAYTPSRWGPGYVEFVIKVYFPENGRPGGAFTPLLDKVRIGETVDTKGPLGEYEYLGDGYYSLTHQPKRYARHVCMIAGGTGITPMWQVLEALQRDRDTPFVSLIYCARSITDLVLVDEINNVKRCNPNRLNVHYVLSQPPPSEDWKGGRGRLKATDIAGRLFPFADSHTQTSDKLVLLCASDEMVKACCRPIISELMGNEFASNNIFVF